MKKFCVLFLAIMQFTTGKAQSDVFRSLELYNFYYTNPAYIISDSKFQLDLIPFYLTEKGITSNFILSAPKLNSGFGLGFERLKFMDLSYTRFTGDYAYGYSFTDKMNISGGIRLNYNLSNLEQANFQDQPVKRVKLINTVIGARFQYSKLHFGLSVLVPLLYNLEMYTSEDVTEIVKQPNPDNSYQFLCGYSLGKRKIRFDPVFSMQYKQGNTSWYLGANTMFFNVFGIGLTAGDLNSVSLTFKIPEKVSFNFVLLSGEEYNTYGLSFSPLEILGQIKIIL